MRRHSRRHGSCAIIRWWLACLCVFEGVLRISRRADVWLRRATYGYAVANCDLHVRGTHEYPRSFAVLRTGRAGAQQDPTNIKVFGSGLFVSRKAKNPKEKVRFRTFSMLKRGERPGTILMQISSVGSFKGIIAHQPKAPNACPEAFQRPEVICDTLHSTLYKRRRHARAEDAPPPTLLSPG